MIDIRQTQRYASYLNKLGWTVERKAGVNYFIKKLPFIGSIIKVQRPEEIKINIIKNLAKKYHARKIVIEPKTKIDKNYLKRVGYKLSKSPFLPTKTLQLDLSKSREQLLKLFKKDARRAVKKTEGLIPKRNIKLESFRKKWKHSVGLKRYVPPTSHLKALKKSFKEDCLFLTIENSGAIFLKGDKIAYYWQAFTDKEGRKNLYQYKIVWEGILWAKKRGAKLFDFEGIYDKRFPNKSWAGFTHFKKSFGGKNKKYEGTYTKWQIGK